MQNSTPVPSAPSDPTHRDRTPAEQLQRLWDEGRAHDVDAFLAQQGPLTPDQVALVLHVDQRGRWRTGDAVLAETYLQRYPAVAADRDIAVDLIFNEFLLRKGLDDCRGPEDYARRFPGYAGLLVAQIELHLALATDGGALTVESSPTAAAVTPVAVLGGEAALPPAPAGYVLLEELGRGGMGVVYKARQTSLKRVVALKMLLAGPYAGLEHLDRFRAEAEAVARLRHPNIVQIFEVGEHGGRPYLVLEYHAGGSLDRKLSGTPQNPRAAAETVETLSRAVHAAHQQGVVHRDLKPANVLLAEDGTPKVADFGLAKQMDSGMGRTPSEAILGTPSYMAPEQALGRTRDVGPPADVYALGAILYELLTGRPPFRGETSLDTLQQVVADDPVPPRVLQPKVPHDLETICMKSLRKEPAKRYASAETLADDLRHFLAGEPILARPLGPAGRLWRWCRRKPALAGVTGALILVAAGALTGLTALWLRAEHHRRMAELRQEEATADLQLAREAIDNYATRVSENLRLRQEDLRPLRKELLETVVPLYEKLIARHADSAEVQAEFGDAYVRLAFIVRDSEGPSRACQLLEQAAAVFAALANRHPDVGHYRHRLADVRIDLGESYQSLDRHGEAEASFQESLKGWNRLAEDDPGEPNYELGEAHARVGLAQLYGKTQRVADARAEYLRLLEVADRLERRSVPIPAERQRAFAIARLNLAQIYLIGGDFAPAESELRRAIATQTELLRAYPFAADYKQDLARSRMTLGNIHWKAGQVTTAEEEFQKSLQLSEELVHDNPSVLYFPEYLADSRHALARFYAATRQPSLAAPELKKVLDTLEALPPAYRDLTTNQERLARAHRDRSAALAAIGLYKEAAAESEQAIKVLAALLERQPSRDSYRDDLTSNHMQLASAHMALRRLDEAEAEYKEVLKVVEQLAQQHPNEASYQRSLVQCHSELGRCYYARGQKRECEESLRAAVKIGEELDGNDSEVLTSLAKAHNNLAVLYAATDRLTLSGEEYVEALKLVRRLVDADPHTTEHHVMLGIYCANLGIQQRNTGQLEASLDTFASAIRALEVVLHREEKHVRARLALGSAHWDRALALNRLGRAAEALPDWEMALALDTGERRASILANRAESLARAGDHARAMKEAEALLTGKDVDPALVYWMAWVCTYAKTAAEKDGVLPPEERSRLAERYASRAVALLRQADAAGHFKDPDVLREFQTAPDLDPLRKRPDFLQLLADIEKKAKPE